MSAALDLDVAIFGGGAAGLWMLDELQRAGYGAVLLEAIALGSGQTIASQGIIHGGLKYSLRGMVTPSARAIREMPLVWRRCLAGEADPDLRATRLRAEYCYLWQTRALKSRVAMYGARASLRVAPSPLDRDERPDVLGECPGVVARLEEQVIEPESFIRTLATRHADRLLQVDVTSGLEFTEGSRGVELLRLLDPARGEPLDLRPRWVILCAGAGNRMLRNAIGLPSGRTQHRPLHMVVVRGGLPTLNGHCVDGMRTRATIVTTRDHADEAIWVIGGQIAEDGVRMEPRALVEHARRELESIVPTLDLRDRAWSTYRVDRAEIAVPGGRRPTEARWIKERNVITAWPTKLALAPQLATIVRAEIAASDRNEHPSTKGVDPIDPAQTSKLRAWTRPDIAMAPWETSPWIDAR